MPTFDELTHPTPGWELDQIRNVSALWDTPYWEVILVRVADGKVRSNTHTDLEYAWSGAVCAAEAADVQAGVA